MGEKARRRRGDPKTGCSYYIHAVEAERVRIFAVELVHSCPLVLSVEGGEHLHPNGRGLAPLLGDAQPVRGRVQWENELADILLVTEGHVRVCDCALDLCVCGGGGGGGGGWVCVCVYFIRSSTPQNLHTHHPRGRSVQADVRTHTHHPSRFSSQITYTQRTHTHTHIQTRARPNALARARTDTPAWKQRALQRLPRSPAF